MSSTPFVVYEYEDEDGKSEIRDWRKQLRKSNPKASAKVDWLIDRLEEKGIDLKWPYSGHIRGPIYELRGRVGHDFVRVYYWQQEKEIFIASGGELKKKSKADKKLIQKALDAYKEYNEE